MHAGPIGLPCVAVICLAFISLACAETMKMESPPPSYTRVLVTKFGAKANDGKDDTAAFAKAIQYCVARPATALILPKGRYDFYSAKRLTRQRYQMTIAGARKLIIDGRGSKLVFHGKTAPFWVTDCHDITFMNFTIDWDDPVMSAGIITRADKRSFDVELTREYTGEGSKKIESVIEFDAETHVPKRKGRDVHDLPHSSWPTIKSYEKIDDKTLRFTLSQDRVMSKGALAIIRHQVYVYNGFTVHDCKELTLKDVTIHFVPGMGISARRINNVLLKRVRMAPPKGSDRVLSISSDGTHFSDCTGTIRIEDCYFQGMGDDATNIHGYFYDVVKAPEGNVVEVKCKETWICPVGVGSVMEFTDPNTLLPFSTGKVTACKVNRRTKIHRLTFDQPVPKGVKVGTLLANATWTPKARISGNIVKGNRARGFVIKTRDAIVENNTFESVSGAGVFIATEGDHWREAIGTRDVIVRNNTFTNCDCGPSRRWAVISAFAYTPRAPGRDRHGQAGVHQRLLIENNVIRGTDNGGIFVSAVDGAVVRKNTISNCSRLPTWKEGAYAVYILNSRNVTVRDNVLTKPGRRMRKPLAVGKGVDEKTVTVEGNSWQK